MARPTESVVDGSKASPPAHPKDLPAVDRLLRHAAAAALVDEHGHTLVAGQARALLETLRTQAVAGTLAGASLTLEALAAELALRVSARLQPRMRRVLNPRRAPAARWTNWPRRCVRCRCRCSRIATATGLSRREVTRLTQTAATPPRRRPVAAEVFARWASDPLYRDARGRPRKLPRQGDAPSFETLAQLVTRDVHRRTLLDELLRLGLAAADAADDSVALVHDAFVPRGDTERMLDFLGHNVGDHLDAAVANVLGNGRQHFEQAVFADELSSQSLAAIRESIEARWRAMCTTLVPQLKELIDADHAAGRPQNQRLRVGLFSYSERMSEPAPMAATPDSTVAPATDMPPPNTPKGARS
jgi:hypothetical protein